MKPACSSAVARGLPPSVGYRLAPWGFQDDRAGRRRKRLGLAVILGGLLLGTGSIFLLLRVGGSNYHVTTEHEWYRSAQMSPGQLELILKQEEIRTVLVLRGNNADDDDWFQPEIEICERYEVRHVIAKLPTSRLPWRSELQTLFEELDRIETPVLVHCKSGSDRTGLVSTIWLHDYRSVPLREARKQLAFFPYMHVSWGGASSLQDFLDMYVEWQTAHPRTPLKIRDWVKQYYFEEKPGRDLEPWYDGTLYRPSP